jgi:hypothetical protein
LQALRKKQLPRQKIHLRELRLWLRLKDAQVRVEEH